MQSNTTANKAITELENTIKQIQSAKSEGIDLGALFSGLASFIIPCVICIISIVASVMVAQMQSGGIGASPSTLPMPSVTKYLMTSNLGQFT